MSRQCLVDPTPSKAALVERNMSYESSFPQPEPLDASEAPVLSPDCEPVVIDRTVHVHRPCQACGYDLFGLDRDGACPECGSPVAKSLAGDVLSNCSRRFVEQLRIGMLLVGSGAVCASVVYFVLTVLMLGPARSLTSFIGQPELELVRTLATAAFGLLSAVGWWILSAKDPSYFGPDPAAGTRSFVRVMVVLDGFVAIFGAGAMVAAIALGALAPRGGGGIVQALVGLQYVVWWVIQIAGWFPKMRYVALVARRVPNRSLESFATVVMWLGLLKLVVCVGEVPCLVLAVILYVRMVRALDAVLREMPNDRAL